MTKKSGMLAVALEKVRELRAALDDRREKLCEARDTIEQLSAEVLALRQGSDRLVWDLKASNDEVARQRVELHKYEGWIYNTDQLVAQISRLEAKLKFRTEVLQLWIDNPVNTELDAEVTDLRHHFQVLSAQAQELLRGNELLTNQVKELISQRNQLLKAPNIKLEGAKQRITELEAALNYFNGLHQTGDDHKASSQERIGQLSEQLDRAEGMIESLESELVRRNSVIEGLRFQKVDAAKTEDIRDLELKLKDKEHHVKAVEGTNARLYHRIDELKGQLLAAGIEEIKFNAQSFEKVVRDRVAACNNSPGQSTFSKVWNWLTKDRKL